MAVAYRSPASSPDKPAWQHARKSPRVASRSARVLGRLIAVTVAFALVLAYVGMTAQLAALTYRLAEERTHHASLIEREEHLRQTAAALQSLPRLEAVAMKLRMRQPVHVASARLRPNAIAARPQKPRLHRATSALR